MVRGDRTEAFQRVCDAALAHFSVAGYDGASLNEIALLVGIRKASLYSHVASKEALYLQILQDAVEVEECYVRQVLGPLSKGELPGQAYVSTIAQRYADSVHLRFLLRAAFLPPEQLRATVGPTYEGFVSQLQDCFATQLDACVVAPLLPQVSERFAIAYAGIVESLYVELIYAGRIKMAKREEAMWHLFAQSLSPHVKRC
ncbi:TetR/AcrR family transcriptional regulator [Lampropedia puyangensis]|uniref:TetR/AcrR family transcriptional regulator n=1 Tax=Lampropedia puyangensis TaxID=1330072 RepID=A0A4V4GRT9_9BURK|nr:TetR/AcrR family transcriptional regulator [Lampropedia puyangensis]THU01986.1 TetR/AcrR family transcriptional regulator [Lampropedia puyangensis]